MSADQERAPHTLGKYEVRRELGRGGMSIVYEGFDPLIGRRVALKTFLTAPQEGGGEADNLLSRLRREAQAAGRLNHPNIVAIYDYGEEKLRTPDGQERSSAYIAMEYVDGRSLESHLEANERFPLTEVVRILAQILGALEYSHEHGVIHRDIKPGNVLLLPDGTVKVADFGIARIESSTLTQVGTVIGSPAYMSPEQFMGQTVDARSDLYSAGVVLYQLLTAELPFTGSYATLMHRVLNEQATRPSALNVQVPPALDPIVQKAMARRPDERYQSAGEFRAALSTIPTVATPVAPPPLSPVGNTVLRTASLAALPAGTAPPIPTGNRRRMPWIVLGALACLAATASAWWIMSPRLSRPLPAAHARPAPATLIKPNAGMPSAASALLETPADARSAVVSALAIVHAGAQNGAATEQALWLEARRQLIAKAAALYVEPRSLESNYAVLNARLFPHADQFITGVLQQSPARRSADGAMLGTLWATVNVRDVQKALNEISQAERVQFIRNHGNPRIAVRIRARSEDSNSDAPAPRSAVAENILKDHIRAFGFAVVDQNAHPPADFYVDGEVHFKRLSARLAASGLTIEKFVLTSWTVKAIDAKSGEEVYHNTQIPEKQSWATEELALADIGKLVGEEFSPAFFLQYFDFKPMHVQLRFEGLPPDDAGRVLDAINGQLDVLNAVLVSAPGEPVKVEVELSPSDEALPLLLQRSILSPLNAPLGTTCFSLGNVAETSAVVRLDPSCAASERLRGLESAPREALAEEPTRT